VRVAGQTRYICETLLSMPRLFLDGRKTLAEVLDAMEAVSPFLAWIIGSPCLRRCVHGASIGGGTGWAGCGGGAARHPRRSGAASAIRAGRRTEPPAGCAHATREAVLDLAGKAASLLASATGRIMIVIRTAAAANMAVNVVEYQSFLIMDSLVWHLRRGAMGVLCYPRLQTQNTLMVSVSAIRHPVPGKAAVAAIIGSVFTE
jgi:hypothetical protein